MIKVCQVCSSDNLAPVRKGAAFYCLNCHSTTRATSMELPKKRPWKRRVPREASEERFRPHVPAAISREIIMIKKRITFLEEWANKAREA